MGSDACLLLLFYIFLSVVCNIASVLVFAYQIEEGKSVQVKSIRMAVETELKSRLP